MLLDLCRLHSDFPDFDPEPRPRSDGETAHRLHLPPLKLGRRFDWAELRLPNGFPDKALARIALQPDTVLRIPHIESGGYLCTQGDPGPDSGLDSNDRVLSLLIAYQDEFLIPWQLGQLDADFAKEPLSYWDIYCQQKRSKRDPVRRIYTVNRPSEVPRLGEGVLLGGSRWIVAGDRSTSEVNRVIKTLSAPKEQQTLVRIAEIPISSPLTPRTWSKTEEALDDVLRSHLPNRGYTEFHEPKRRNVRCYRLVLFRHPDYSFGYLMPGGPPVKLHEHGHKKTYPAPSKVLPLPVSRFDPEWTVGRDQVPAVSSRREQHVVVLGAGALGSSVIKHLARAGIGRITIVDPDIMMPENIGRHSLGGEVVGQGKAPAMAARLSRAYPSCDIEAKESTAQSWFERYPLAGVDLLLDLTGEPEVRWSMDQSRARKDCHSLIAWMEPFVAAAHACRLPKGVRWYQGHHDPLRSLEAVEWPDEVLRQQPGCSSRFQSYTAVAAGFAVAMVTEQALDMLDNGIVAPQVVSWVRGQPYLDKHYPGLTHRDWVSGSTPQDSWIQTRPFP